MTISYPLSFPSSPKPNKAQVIARSNVGMTESQFSYSTQKQVHSGQRWEIDLTLPKMTDAQAGEWLAFLLSLNGVEGTALVPEPDRTTPQGVGTGTPLVDGGSQTGNSIDTKGWTSATASIMKAGDVMQIGNYMYMVLADVSSGASGSATIDIWPNLRSSPADEATITVNGVKTLMRLASNEMGWSTDSMKHYGLSINFIEELPSS